MNSIVESPIEDDLLDALVRVTAGRARVIMHRVSLDKIEAQVRNEPSHRLFIATQVSAGRYRADFILAHGIKRLCVECDGAEFHGQSIGQISRDFHRDEWFLSIGVPTLRLSGKRIVRDPYKCAHMALQMVTGEDFRDHEAVSLSGPLANVIGRCAANYSAGDRT